VLIQQNLRDSLTNAFNHRFFTMRLAEEVERQHRYGGHLSVMLIDIDHFKEVNDTYGHVCGDFILKSVSDSIQTSIRKMDVMARYGGEEFCCILPETETVHAAVLAERIRETIAEEEYVYEGHPIRVTVSIGVSGTVEGMSPRRLPAQERGCGMYKAKKSGRNSVVSFTEGPAARGIRKIRNSPTGRKRHRFRQSPFGGGQEIENQRHGASWPLFQSWFRCNPALLGAGEMKIFQNFRPGNTKSPGRNPASAT
jgi:diguanylate cyclase (GGDEF)-like protein